MKDVSFISSGRSYANYKKKITLAEIEDASRFGGSIKGNFKILKVFIATVFADFKNLFLTKKNI